FSNRRRDTRSKRDWSSDVCSSDLLPRNSLFTFRFIDMFGLIHEYNGMRRKLVLHLSIDSRNTTTIIDNHHATEEEKTCSHYSNSLLRRKRLKQCLNLRLLK